MEDNKMLKFIRDVLVNMPSDWLKLTTHRLDVFNEKLAKTEFLDQFEKLYNEGNSNANSLAELPTAFDYIRLGHPLSSILEWYISKAHNLNSKNVISFSSSTIPILAILRANLITGKKTKIFYTGELPSSFDVKVLRNVYAYQFELQQIENVEEISAYNGSSIYYSQQNNICNINIPKGIDFFISAIDHIGSIILVNGLENENYISDIQHVRRRETIAMTPANSLAALNMLTNQSSDAVEEPNTAKNKSSVYESIAEITGAKSRAILGSCGLSIQYAIMMGLIHDALEKHPGKEIKIVVPPNCYGGTNDQARRVAACMENVSIVDLPVDGDNDMVQSIDLVLNKIAQEDAIPYIIAEIPTNPRVEVPELIKLRDVLSLERKTPSGAIAIDPVFILDQTFCPNVHFLGEGEILSTVRTISYVSGSKFPSGGLCTAGYCVANEMTNPLMAKIEMHLNLCGNQATSHQIKTLADQLPSMNQRIHDAYKNTREFVDYIKQTLPDAKINFVSEDLAKEDFTPSVFSLDLPTKGNTPEEKEAYKRALNLTLINKMITKIPEESKFCVSYGQLKGSYWTVPATSTQGTTREGDKDYIVRVSLSPNMDIKKHQEVFADFVKNNL